MDPLFQSALRLGDNALVLSHRVSEWLGHAPALEEDLALGNVALDLLGQARLWLDLAGAIEGAGRDADRLAYWRDAGEFRNLLLCERPNGDFAVTMTRQYFFDAWHFLALQSLAGSGDARFAGIAAKAQREAAYHVERSREWMVRLGDGTQESRVRMERAVEALWPFTGEMFEADDADRAALAQGCALDAPALHAPWLAEVTATLGEATLAVPSAAWMQRGGRKGVHTEHLGYILADMQHVQKTHPGATW